MRFCGRKGSSRRHARMQRLTGHHWITHSVIVLGIFGVFGWLFAQANGRRGITMTVNRLISMFVGGALMGILGILAFYLFGD